MTTILQQVTQLAEDCIPDQNYSINSFEDDGTQNIVIAVYHSKETGYKVNEAQHFKNQLEEKFTECKFETEYNPNNTQITVSVNI